MTAKSRPRPVTVKALSVRQPWANLIVTGLKTIETRWWRTGYRGDLLICSTRTPAIDPAGYALALATLVDCRPMNPVDEEAARCGWADKLYAWVLDDIRRLREPFRICGQQRLFTVTIPPNGLRLGPARKIA